MSTIRCMASSNGSMPSTLRHVRAESFRRASLANGIDPNIRPRGPAHFGEHIERLIGTMVGKMRVLLAERDPARWLRCRSGCGNDLRRVRALAVVPDRSLPRHTARGAGRGCPAQVWEREAAGDAPLLPAWLAIGHLTRQFLPASELTVHSYSVQIRHRR